MGSISHNVHNDLEATLVIYKRMRFASGHLCELSPEISCVLYFGLLFNIIHSGHKLCAYRIHIVGSETFEGIYFEKYSERLRYCLILFSLP